MFSTQSFKKAVGIASVWVFSLSVSAFAAEKGGLNIKQVQVGDQARVDLLLDGKIQESQIRTEFINDIIQLSLSDTSVYPAKISSISGQELTKIFVYQYAPKLVRVRLTVKGKAEAYQGKVSVRPNGKVLSIQLSGNTASDQVAAKAAQMRKKPEPAPATTDAEERALLDRILSADKPAEKPAEKVQEKTQEKLATRPSKVTRPEEIVNPGRALASFAGVMLLLVACFFALKRLASSAGKGQKGALGRLLTKTLGQPAKMIDVVATHYLGPKKSIHVVRVAGRTLVLGVSDGSINLITEFNGEMPAAAAVASSVEPGTGDFLSELGEQIARESGGASNKASMGAGAQAAGPAIPAPQQSARDRIRSRLEGMKQL